MARLAVPAVKGSNVLALALFLLLTAPQYALPQAEGKEKKTPAAALEEVQNLVQSILEGRDLAALKARISPEAYLVDGSTYRNLLDVLYGSMKIKLFPHSQKYTLNFKSCHLADDLSSGYCIYKITTSDSATTRLHSVFLMRSDTSGGLQIVHWHASR